MIKKNKTSKTKKIKEESPNIDLSIIPEVEYSEIMEESYIDYSLSVIIGRAIPDVRDGLKPVHRRILFAMCLLGLLPEKGYRKSARIVGEVLGKYHPHGETKGKYHHIGKYSA